jgi:hypothetical protein
VKQVPFEDIQTGSVVEYQYLWRREAAGGEVEGRKRRPVAVAFRVPSGDAEIVYLMPITTKQPEPGVIAAEIPQIEKRRAGLNADLRQWIILEEFNADIIPGSYVLEPDAKIGDFGKKFFQSIMAIWKLNYARTRITKRR